MKEGDDESRLMRRSHSFLSSSFRIAALRTLDVSKNKLTALGRIEVLTNLKSLHCEENQLPPGALSKIATLSKLQTLFAGGNQLGKGAVSAALPSALPAALKQVVLDHNFFSSVPPSLVSKRLIKLEKLDLSYNQLAALPEEVANLTKLEELKLDHNVIVSLPQAVGKLTKLKTLSLKNNRISIQSMHFSAKNPQPLPATLFSNTPVIDLNLHGNRLTSTQLNQFEGYAKFLERRQKVKTNTLYGGALTNLDVCGLE